MSDHLSDSTSSPVSGSFTLLIGNSVALIFTAVGSVLVALMLSPSEYGLFSITLVLPNMFCLFSDWGINQGLVRYIAQYGSSGKLGDVSDLATTGYIIKFIIGSILSLILFLSADFLAVFLLKRPEIGGFIKLTSALVLSQSIYSTAIAILAGSEKMNYRAAINILQSIVKGGVSPLLVYLGYGISGVIFGHLFSFFIAAFIGLIFTRSIFNLSNRLQYKRVKENAKLLLLFGFPLYIGNIVLGFTLSIRGLLLSWFTSNETIGNYSISSWFIIYIGIITSSIDVNLFSTFSKYNFKNETKKVKEIFQGSIRYFSMLLLPIICLSIIVSKPLIYTIFADKYPQAPLLLSIRLIPIIFIGIGSAFNIGLLNSQAETRASALIIIISSLISIILSTIFIYYWGITGLVSSYILSSCIKYLLGVYIIRKKYNVEPNINHAIKILISSLISMVLTYAFLYYYSTLPLVDLFCGVTIFTVSILLVAPLIGVIEIFDINNLHSMLRGLKIIYPFTRPILDFEYNILKLRSRITNRALENM